MRDGCHPDIGALEGDTRGSAAYHDASGHLCRGSLRRCAIRRVLLVLVAASTLLLSIGAGIVAADWPFWRRVISLPPDLGEWPESFYQPRVSIDGGDRAWFPVAAPDALTIEAAALDEAARWAESRNSVALLVLHRGRVQLERYWQGMTAEQLYSGRAMSRSLIGFLYGHALASGAIESLDQPASDYLAEWRDDPRGAITVRQLLQNTSGLEEPEASNPLAPQSRAERLFDLTGKHSRLALGGDFASVALSFELAYEPGKRFAFSNVNAQLLGVILERATGKPYERYVEEHLWKPLGAGIAELYMDRVNGMPATYCCFRATPRDYLRLGALLVDDAAAKQGIVPSGWMARMTRGSNANPIYGMQIWAGRAAQGLREYIPGSGIGVRHAEAYVSDEVIWMEGGGGRTIWAIPAESLVIVRLGRGSPDWDGSVLPNLLVSAVKR